MPGFKVNSIVRVASQPANQCAQIKGQVGYIQEIDGDMCLIRALNLDGSTAGEGSVPLSCLAICNDSQWANAKRSHETQFDVLFDQYQRRTEAWHRLIKNVAKKHGISEQAVKEIHDELNSFDTPS